MFAGLRPAKDSSTPLFARIVCRQSVGTHFFVTWSHSFMRNQKGPTSIGDRASYGVEVRRSGVYQSFQIISFPLPLEIISSADADNTGTRAVCVGPALVGVNGFVFVGEICGENLEIEVADADTCARV